MAVEEIATALIQAGVDVHHRDHDGLIPSLYAKCCGALGEWCRALECNGFCVEDVLREEGTEWLLHDSWQRMWAGKYGALR